MSKSADVLKKIDQKIFKTKNLALEFSDKYFSEEVNDYSFKDYVFDNRFTIKEHNLKAFDGNTIKSLELKINDGHDYVFIINGLNNSVMDEVVFAEGLKELNFNIVLINHRNIKAYNQKDLFDALEWIDYFIALDRDINIYLLGENEGANILVKMTKTIMPTNVKCLILDNLRPNSLNEKLSDFSKEKGIKNTSSLKRNVADIIAKKYDFDIKELNIDDDLKDNKLPLLFIFNQLRSKEDYKRVLRVYNKSSGNKKFYYTSHNKRSVLEDNYFETLKYFIVNFVID